jgi:hypothetical protein
MMVLCIPEDVSGIFTPSNFVSQSGVMISGNRSVLPQTSVFAVVDGYTYGQKSMVILKLIGAVPLCYVNLIV